MNLVASREKPYRKEGERYGGAEEKPIGSEEKQKVMYPTGPNLTAVGRKMGFSHKPLDKRGNAICFNFSEHSGCAKGDACLFSHLQRIRPGGLHWAIKYDLARRGGLVSGKRMDPTDVEGFLQALRSQNSEEEVKKSIEESRGSIGRGPVTDRVFWFAPPGLNAVFDEGTTSSTTDVLVEMPTTEAKCKWEVGKKEMWCDSNIARRQDLGGETQFVAMQRQESDTRPKPARSISEGEGESNTSREGEMLRLDVGDSVKRSDAYQLGKNDLLGNLPPIVEIEEEERREKPPRTKTKKLQTPVILDGEDYLTRCMEYNPGVDRIPHDFLRFYPTELETPLRELLHANDHWAYIQEKEGKEWEFPHLKTEMENGIDQLIARRDFLGNQAAFARGRLLSDSGNLQGRFDRALVEMNGDGPSYMHQINLVKNIVSLAGESQQVARQKRGEGFITWGNKAPLGDCEVQELAIGNLHFRAIAYGDTIRLSERSRILMGNIEHQVENQFVSLHAAAGAQSSREGRKNVAPTLARVLSAAEEWRTEEFRHALNALIEVGDRRSEFAAEIRSAAHDALQPGHDRDYRGFVLFFHELLARNKSTIRVPDRRNRDGG